MRVWAEIDLQALLHNYRAIRAQVAPGVGVMCVLKADGYGHGAAHAARVLDRAGAPRFAVADVA